MRKAGLFAVAAMVIVSASISLLDKRFLPGATPTPTPRPDYELIEAGGFEQGLTNWELGGQEFPRWDNTEKHSGKGSVKLNRNTIQKRFVTSDETPVVLKFSAKSASSTKLNVYTMCSAEFWQEIVDVGSEWQEYTFDITENSLNQEDECVVFENETAIDVWLDDISVTQGIP